MSPDDSLFDVVPGQTHYKPQPTFLLPDDHGDHRRGPAAPASQGPQDATAPDYWNREAESVLFALVAAQGYVTSDDLRAHYPDHPSATAAAVGALFRRLSQQGRLILDHHRPSTRPEARGRVVGVWKLPRYGHG